jgi:hypothetical protein
VQSELLALVNTAKLASMQAERLEVLDAEVAQLQKVLVRVGQHIKSGAQQQQVSTPACTDKSCRSRTSRTPLRMQQCCFALGVILCVVLNRALNLFLLLL